MAFDRSRPIPWRRIIVPFLVYAAVVNAVFLLFFRESAASLLLGTVVGGVVYVLLAALLSKFGWQPATMKRRPKPATTEPTAPASSPSGAPKAKPAATRRTNAGNPRAKRR